MEQTEIIEKERKRPVLISIVCILGYIWITYSFPSVFSPSVKKLGDWFPALFGLIVACTFISFIGVWHMKKWGVQLFAITFFVKTILLVWIDDLNYVGLVFSVLFISAMLSFYRRMDANL